MKRTDGMFARSRESSSRARQWAIGAVLVSIAAAGLALGQASQGHAQPTGPASQQAGAPLSIKLAGQPEVVIPASAMTCAAGEGIDVPDLPPSAYRRPDGQVVLVASNSQNFAATGPDLGRVERDGCQRLLSRSGDDDPSQFRDKEWLTGVMPLAGNRMLGVVHDEYHGELRNPAQCPRGDAEKLCWYASSTLVLSDDGGRTFARPPAPANVLAAPPGRYADGLQRVSISTPKIVRRGDYLYVLAAFLDRNRNIPIQQCLFRARADAPLDWRAWDGKGFDLKRGSAYAGASAQDCVGVLDGNVPSVKFVSERNLYVALIVDRDGLDYVTSPDLIHWSGRTPLRTYSHFSDFDPAKGEPDWYFSLLSPTSKSAGFDTLDGETYLYFVRFHTQDGKVLRSARDVMRQKVEIR